MKTDTKKVSESLGSDIAKYQRWVDYDMKRFGKISEKTQSEIDKAGLQVIKDQYDNYEVTAGDYEAKESCDDATKTAEALGKDTETTIFVNVIPNDAIWIAEENSSGAEYPYDGTTDSIKAAFNSYMDNQYVISESVASQKRVNIFESLDETDIEVLSTFDLTEEETAHILSLFELISDENKDKAFAIVKSLFEGKKLVPSEDKEVEAEEGLNTTTRKYTISEGYTRMLLGDK